MRNKFGYLIILPINNQLIFRLFFKFYKILYWIVFVCVTLIGVKSKYGSCSGNCTGLIKINNNPLREKKKNSRHLCTKLFMLVIELHIYRLKLYIIITYLSKTIIYYTNCKYFFLLCYFTIFFFYGKELYTKDNYTNNYLYLMEYLLKV